MVNEWSFRHEILLATQRWPQVLLFCLLGSLLGWAISFGWPTPHRATRELFVGLNVYRSVEDRNVSEYAGVELLNANDYKNWQMASLNSLIFMDSVLNETLQRLREQDPYWKDVQLDELAGSLHVYWRNAGKWRLVAENDDPKRAAQAVAVWQEVVVENVHNAVSESQRAMVLEFQLKSIAEERASLLAEAETLKQTSAAFQNWLNQEDEPGESPLEGSERWKLWRLLTRNGMDDSWALLADTFPPETAARSSYRAWVENAISALEQEIQNLNEQAISQSELEAQVTDQFAQASQASLGLSASLDVDKISDSRIEQIIVRPTGTLLWIGSLLGLIAWLILWFSDISLRGRI